MNKILSVKNIFKNFDQRSLGQLKDISFDVLENEVLSIIGPSGTGKTTLLNIIRKEISSDSGEVDYFFDHNKISYVPQSSSLDDSKSVIENIKSGASYLSDGEQIERARNLIEIFSLEYKDHKLPSDLSAGQRQRVEFAKAMMKNPRLLLLDEPFSNLDEFLKDEVISEVFPIFKEQNTSVIFVSHNLEEAFSVSDKTIVLAHGEIQQVDIPSHIYERPSNVFVARFSGKINLFASNFIRNEDENLVVKNTLGEFLVPRQDWSEGKKFLYLALRPENIKISQNKNDLSGKIKRIEYRGAIQNIYIQSLDKNKIIITRPGLEKYKIDQKIYYYLEPSALFTLPI